MKRVIPLSRMLTFKNVYREDSDWDALLDEFRSDPAHWRTVQQLAAELQGNRFFREPLYVGKDAEYDPDSLWVFDGTHRACAYLLAGVQEVEILLEEEDDSPLISPRWSVETQISGEGGYMMSYEGDGELPSLYAALLSLRLSADVWLTSDAATTGDVLTIFWDRAAAVVADAEITAAARSQLRAFGFDMGKLALSTSRIDNDPTGEA